MSQFTEEQNRVNFRVAVETNTTVKEVNKAIDLYFKGVAEKIKIDQPCEIIIPFFGRLVPHKKFLKRFNKNETNNP